MVFCTACGKSVQLGAHFCGSCGQQLPASQSDPANRAPIRAVAERPPAHTDEVATAEARLAELQRDLEAVEEAVEIQSFGFYRPRYGLESSAEYAERLKECRSEQKRLIKTDRAADYPKNWMVDGSAAKGTKMLRDHAKLMLRAFNGECDAAVSRVSYSNVTKLQDRIDKSFDAINQLGESKKTSITIEYKDLKLAELFLVYEHREKLHEEREQQRELKARMREEQAVQKELEKTQRDAEKDETKHRKALEKAKLDLENATDKQHARLETLVDKLQSELSAAIDRKAKSIARAQLTRSGHVYVLSNIGSFGEGVYKIGMTRRLEPLERVYELGDASVPFRFDVHAMIYNEDAPGFERALHREFADRRINKVNLRREYFRVSLEEIRVAVAKFHGTITFVTVPEAEEYRKTVAMDEDTSTAVSEMA